MARRVAGPEWSRSVDGIRDEDRGESAWVRDGDGQSTRGVRRSSRGEGPAGRDWHELAEVPGGRSRQSDPVRVQMAPSRRAGVRHAAGGRRQAAGGRRQAKSIRPSEIAVWLTELTTKYGSSTARSAFLVLFGCLELAVADQLLKRNPAKSKVVKRPSVGEPGIVVWSEKTVDAIVEAHPEQYDPHNPALGASGWRSQGARAPVQLDRREADPSSELRRDGVETCVGDGGRDPTSDSGQSRPPALRDGPQDRDACPAPPLRQRDSSRQSQHQGARRVPGPPRPRVHASPLHASLAVVSRQSAPGRRSPAGAALATAHGAVTEHGRIGGGLSHRRPKSAESAWMTRSAFDLRKRGQPRPFRSWRAMTMRWTWLVPS
jgi:hypothetical protein